MLRGFEALENRKFFSTSMGPGGLLTITGTNSNDQISVDTFNGNKLRVIDNGLIRDYALNAVKKIVASLLTGADSFAGTNNVNIPMQISGGADNDTLKGGARNDTMNGDAGNDLIDGRKGDDDMFGGADTDTVDYSDRTTALWLSLDDVANDGGAGSHDNIHSDIENINGGQSDDTIIGSSVANVLRGNGGSDHISGLAGADAIYGGAGPDVLEGNDGNDTIVDVGGSQSDTIVGGDGLDTIWCDAESTETLQNTNFVDAFLELVAGSVHRVGSFANGAGRDLNGENLTDPSDGTGYVNFSNHPLFSTNGPSKDDIRQGNVGDCWLMATLSAAAKQSQIRIQQTVVPLGDGSYGVDFMRNGAHEFYRVDGDLPTWGGTETSGLKYADMGAQGSIWVPIVEKAYAFYRKHQDTYQSLSGGWPYDAFKALRASPTDISWGSQDSVMNQISAALYASKAIAVCTKGTITSDCPCIGSHCYTVDSMRTVRDHRGGTTVITTYITLRNPWGVDGAGNDGNTSDGLVTITAAQFMANFVSGVTCAV
jgi:Ca2+-binding RTX toxin-like protein